MNREQGHVIARISVPVAVNYTDYTGMTVIYFVPADAAAV